MEDNLTMNGGYATLQVAHVCEGFKRRRQPPRLISKMRKPGATKSAIAFCNLQIATQGAPQPDGGQKIFFKEVSPLAADARPGISSGLAWMLPHSNENERKADND